NLIQIDRLDRKVYYDPRGNMTLSNTQSAVQAYDYDSRNRMTSARLVNGSLVKELARYSYNSSADRFRKDDPNAHRATYYVRNGSGRLMSEFRKRGSGLYVPEWTKHYMYIGDRLFGLRETTLPNPPGGLKA